MQPEGLLRRWRIRVVERGRERGEHLRCDAHHRHSVPILSWSGIGPEHGHDLLVGLERDEHRFGRGDAPTAREAVGE